MPAADHTPDTRKLAAWLLHLLRYLALAGLVYFVIGLGLAVGRSYPLWLEPAYAEGRVVGHVDKSWTGAGGRGASATTTARLPVVVFSTPGQVRIEFTDRLGDRAGSDHVGVIFAASQPQIARVDNGPLLTWVDVYLHGFGLIACLLGVRRFSKARIASQLQRLERADG